MKMTSDRLKVEIIDEDVQTESGIYLADPNPITQTRNNYFKGVVREAGKGRVNDSGVHFPMNVKVGDVIIYPTNHYKRFEDEEKDYHIIHETDVMAIFEGEKHE